MSDAAMLNLDDLHKTYPSGPEVLRGLNLSVSPGEAVAIVGPSGSGKSTLLNLISALDTPDAGRVVLDGEDLSGLSAGRLAKIRNTQIGFVFQLHHLLPQLTLLENVLVPVLAAGGVTRQRVDWAYYLLERVGLDRRAKAHPGELSGGQRQRAAVVRALVNDPKLLLADEPTGSLDRESAGEVADLLVDLNRGQNTALVVVTHSAELAGHMDRTCELRDGVLREVDTTVDAP